jgi:uncharacterized protein
MMFFDPIHFDFRYILVMIPCMLLAGWASMSVKSAIAKASKIRPSSGMSGAEAAARILSAEGLDHVGIEQAQGFLGDHYDPRAKVLRLTPDIYSGRTLAAVGVAAHEAGHAIQDAHNYAALKLRNGIVPMASIGSNFSYILLFAGYFMNAMGLIVAGIGLFTVTVVFQLINLPVEFNASSRAREVLVNHGIVMRHELPPVSKVLNAAAMTYVAATITAVVTLLYYLARFGLLGGRDD